jgi:hypothetical protein
LGAFFAAFRLRRKAAKNRAIRSNSSASGRSLPEACGISASIPCAELVTAGVHAGLKQRHPCRFWALPQAPKNQKRSLTREKSGSLGIKDIARKIEGWPALSLGDVQSILSKTEADDHFKNMNVPDCRFIYTRETIYPTDYIGILDISVESHTALYNAGIFSAGKLFNLDPRFN